MVPSFKTKIASPNIRHKKQRIIKIEKTIEKQLGIMNRNEYEMFALVPINSKSCNDQAFMEMITKYNNPEIAVRISDSNLNLQKLEDIMSNSEKTEHML